MTTQIQRRLYNLIKKRFGSISSFSRQSGYDRMEIQKLLQRWNIDPETEKKLNKLISLVNKTPNNRDPKIITPKDREAIKSAIYAYGGMTKFIKDHPEFNYRTVAKILAGETTRVTKIGVELLRVTGVWSVWKPTVYAAAQGSVTLKS
jgi:hypothetical protein